MQLETTLIGGFLFSVLVSVGLIKVIKQEADDAELKKRGKALCTHVRECLDVFGTAAAAYMFDTRTESFRLRYGWRIWIRRRIVLVISCREEISGMIPNLHELVRSSTEEFLQEHPAVF